MKRTFRRKIRTIVGISLEHDSANGNRRWTMSEQCLVSTYNLRHNHILHAAALGQLNIPVSRNNSPLQLLLITISNLKPMLIIY